MIRLITFWQIKGTFKYNWCLGVAPVQDMDICKYGSDVRTMDVKHTFHWISFSSQCSLHCIYSMCLWKMSGFCLLSSITGRSTHVSGLVLPTTQCWWEWLTYTGFFSLTWGWYGISHIQDILTLSEVRTEVGKWINSRSASILKPLEHRQISYSQTKKSLYLTRSSAFF